MDYMSFVSTDDQRKSGYSTNIAKSDALFCWIVLGEILKEAIYITITLTKVVILL